jgi:Rhs element Vgr protein
VPDSPTPRQGANLHTVALMVDGAELDPKWRLVSIDIVREVNRIPQARIVLLDGSATTANWELSDEPLFEPGKRVEVLAGYHREHESVFEGIVVRHGIQARQGRASKLTIVCKDIAVKLTRGRKSRYFYEVADSDVFETMIAGAGATADVTATTPTHAETVQVQVSDWDWLLARAEANGLLVFVDAGTVKVAPPANESPVVSLTYGATLLEFEAELDCEQQWTSVTTAAWSHADQAVVEAEGSPSAVPESGNLAPSKLAEVLAVDPFHQHHGGALLESELSAWGKSIATRAALAAVRGRARCQGIAAVKPGLTVELLGVGERFGGPAWISAVRHSITPQNWTTDLQFGLDPESVLEQQAVAMPAAAGTIPSIAGLHVGIVTKLEGDPDGANRIQVRLPLVDATAEGLWSRVATLDAGSERGTSFLPDPEDEVLVGFIHGDPRQPVVVGMLHSSAHPAPLPASDDNHVKGYTSRSGVMWLVNDEKPWTKIEMPSGRVVMLDDDAAEICITDGDSKLVINADGVTIESAADIVLKATGDVKIEAANIENAAQSSFKADGGSGTEITSGATLKIEGSLVTIN